MNPPSASPGSRSSGSGSSGSGSSGSGDASYTFSCGRFVVVVLGTGVTVLIVCVPIVLVLAKWNPVAGLVASLAALLLMITAIGVTSKRLIGKAERALRAQENPNPPTT